MRNMPSGANAVRTRSFELEGVALRGSRRPHFLDYQRDLFYVRNRANEGGLIIE